jgi:hypothetical protein
MGESPVNQSSLQPIKIEELTMMNHLASGKHTKNYGKSPFSMGKSWKIHYKW